MYTLTKEDREALVWQMVESPDAYVARISSEFPNADVVIANKIAACKTRMAASPDKRPRAERDAAIQKALLEALPKDRLQMLVNLLIKKGIIKLDELAAIELVRK